MTMVASSLLAFASPGAGTASSTSSPHTPITPRVAEAAAIAAIEKAGRSSDLSASTNSHPSRSSSLNQHSQQHSRQQQQLHQLQRAGISHAASHTVSPPRTLTLMECDYDVNPTELYQAIEAKQWDYCRSFFRKSPAVVSRECQTWVVRKEPNGKLRWRLLPLHAAIIFQSPLDVIELLLGEYPAAAQSKDDQGMLPIHLAFRNETSWGVLEELLTAFPNAIFVKDRKGRTPLQCCPSGSNLSVPKTLDEQLNNCNSKAAGVLDLYSQIAVSSERQRALAESRAVLEARVGALQESHAATVVSLRESWDRQSQDLQQEVAQKTDELSKAQKEIQELKMVLAQKNATQMELTEKLQQVTVALNVAHEKRNQLEVAERTKWQQRRAIWQETHQEMLVLIQGLMEQQSKLLFQLQEADSKRQNVETEWQKGLVEAVQSLQQKLVVTPREQSTQWQNSLQSHHKQATDRLTTILSKTRALWINDNITMNVTTINATPPTSTNPTTTTAPTAATKTTTTTATTAAPTPAAVAAAISNAKAAASSPIKPSVLAMNGITTTLPTPTATTTTTFSTPLVAPTNTGAATADADAAKSTPHATATSSADTKAKFTPKFTPLPIATRSISDSRFVSPTAKSSTTQHGATPSYSDFKTATAATAAAAKSSSTTQPVDAAPVVTSPKTAAAKPTVAFNTPVSAGLVISSAATTTTDTTTTTATTIRRQLQPPVEEEKKEKEDVLSKNGRIIVTNNSKSRPKVHTFYPLPALDP